MRLRPATGSWRFSWEGWQQTIPHRKGSTLETWSSEFLAWVRGYANVYGAEQVRFVFWFDN